MSTDILDTVTKAISLYNGAEFVVFHIYGDRETYPDKAELLEAANSNGYDVYGIATASNGRDWFTSAVMLRKKAEKETVK